MNKSMEKIKRKIGQLIAKSRGTDNAFEQQAFMEKAMTMLKAHNLDIKDIDDNPLGVTAQSQSYARTFIPLINALAMLFDCKPCFDPDGSFDLVGRESNRITANLIIPFVIEQIDDLAKEALPDAFESFRDEIINALIRRVFFIILKSGKLIPGSALVPKEVTDFIEENVDTNVKSMERDMTTSLSAEELADKISLNVQLKNTPMESIR